MSDVLSDLQKDFRWLLFFLALAVGYTAAVYFRGRHDGKAAVAKVAAAAKRAADSSMVVWDSLQAIEDRKAAKLIGDLIGQAEDARAAAVAASTAASEGQVVVAKAKQALAGAKTQADSLGKALTTIAAQDVAYQNLNTAFEAEKMATARLSVALSTALQSDTTHIAEIARERAGRIAAENRPVPQACGIVCPSTSVAFLGGAAASALTILGIVVVASQ